MIDTCFAGEFHPVRNRLTYFTDYLFGSPNTKSVGNGKHVISGDPLEFTGHGRNGNTEGSKLSGIMIGASSMPSFTKCG